MKKCSASLAIKEMQMKMKLRVHLTPVRMANIKKTNKNKCCRECGEVGRELLGSLWECKFMQQLNKTKNSPTL
jgi:hypothetical protein